MEVEEPPATAASVPVDDDQGAGRMGWIVTIALAGVTAATGGTVFLQGGQAVESAVVSQALGP